MSDTAPAPDNAIDAAGMGYAVLMADVEGAVSAAGDQIALLGRIVEQGFAGMSSASPAPAQPAAAQRSEAPELPTRPASDEPGSSTPSTAPEPASREEAVSGRLAPSMSPPTVAAPALAPSGPAKAEATELGDTRPLPIGTEALGAGSTIQVAPTSPLSVKEPGSKPADAPERTIDSAVAPDRPPATLAPIAGEEWPAGRALAGSRDDTHDAGPVWQSNAAVAPSVPGLRSPLAPIGRAEPMRRESARADRGGGEMDHGSTPMHGDVFLDGVKVGHWMGELMARAAGGPARGGTAFDPRLGPRWPGALQGQ